MDNKQSAVVQGTLDMLILKTLALEPMHGYGIGVRIEQISRGVFQVNAGLAPATLSTPCRSMTAYIRAFVGRTPKASASKASFRATPVRCFQRFVVSNGTDSSRENGEPRKTTGAPSTTRSHLRGGQL